MSETYQEYRAGLEQAEKERILKEKSLKELFNDIYLNSNLYQEKALKDLLIEFALEYEVEIE